jgi:hypothetical protein
MVMADISTPRQTFVLNRGAYDNPGEPVTAGVPAVLPRFRAAAQQSAGIGENGSWIGRIAYAQVTVNRFGNRFWFRYRQDSG